MKIFLFIFLSIFSYKSSKSLALDTLNSGELLIDDGQSLTSSGENFELGFFTPWNSNNRYVGIWFKKVSTLTPYWVANNQNPMPNFNFTGVLTLTPNGDVLVIDNMTSFIYWSSNSSSESVISPRLTLLDSGNLVVADGDTGEYIWQSFDYPGDTMVSGMKLGSDSVRQRETWLTSWRSLTDASPGEYTYKLDTSGLPEMILRRDNQIQMRSGPWDGYNFGGFPNRRSNAVVTPFFTYNSSGIYYGFTDDSPTITRFVVNQTGLVEHQQWSPTRSLWLTMATVQRDNCDNFNHCGPNAICNINNEPECRCADGFRPKTLQGWQRFDWSDGCVPIIPNDCSRKMGFMVFRRLKLPANSIFLAISSAIECEETCLSNCTCVGYAKIDVPGCVIWFGDFIDIKEYVDDGQTLYLKLDASELVSGSRGRRKRTPLIALVVSVISAVILLGLIVFLIRKRTAPESKVLTDEGKNMLSQELKSTEQEDLELPLFEYATVLTATNNLSHANKIGEGGFGAVFKGVLPNGQEIAVKKLSKDSGQGTHEFKNEVILYLKLQHRNLVRLFGCCIHGEEKMLVYEYLPNRSLDLIIFNQTRGTSLDWAKRYEIIVGIARGLLYLHRDSRLRIIHRDLKASNILLDKSMNPKISDFGLAKAFGADQNEEITKRIVGTYGYMSPEYAVDGYYSIKSDVFSFGVLVLEIISGKKNRGFFDPDHSLNLLGHAWKLWIEGTPMDLVDELLEGPINTSEALRCIHMGLLCVQQKPEHRPTMSSVLWMLDSENPVLPQPKQPGFYTERFMKSNSTSGGKYPIHSSNEVTSTVIYEGR